MNKLVYMHVWMCELHDGLVVNGVQIYVENQKCEFHLL